MNQGIHSIRYMSSTWRQASGTALWTSIASMLINDCKPISTCSVSKDSEMKTDSTTSLTNTYGETGCMVNPCHRIQTGMTAYDRRHTISNLCSQISRTPAALRSCK